MVKCEYCGQKNKKEREECRACGAPLPDVLEPNIPMPIVDIPMQPYYPYYPYYQQPTHEWWRYSTGVASGNITYTAATNATQALYAV